MSDFRHRLPNPVPPTMNICRPLRHAATIFATLALVMLLAVSAQACPNCARGIANQSDGGDLVSGFQWSILFMMGMPFTIFATFSGYMYLEVRRARAKQSRDDSPRADLPPCDDDADE